MLEAHDGREEKTIEIWIGSNGITEMHLKLLAEKRARTHICTKREREKPARTEKKIGSNSELSTQHFVLRKTVVNGLSLHITALFTIEHKFTHCSAIKATKAIRSLVRECRAALSALRRKIALRSFALVWPLLSH